MTLRILSFGAGVEDGERRCLHARAEVPDPASVLLMSDTGGEKPETYAYLRDHFLPWATAHGQTLVTIAPPETLYDYAMRRQMVPSINTRWCTSESKIRPIKRWLREQGATRADPADVQVGISADEAHRAVDGWSVKYQQKRWPLVEMHLTRADCQAIIASEGLPPPPKSGCWFCPYQRQAQWRQLANEHPDLADQALTLEANAMQRNPRDVLVGGRLSLRDLLRNGGAQLPMAFDDALDNDAGCTTGACFV